MTRFFWTILMTPPQGAGAQNANPIMTYLPLVMIAFIFYFMIYRPQKKRQKDREALINRMEKGDKVITSSGIHGTVSSIDEKTILVQVSDSTKIRFEKASVTTVIPKGSEAV